MMWQDLVFTVGSGLSIAFLAPTLRNAAANVPLGTSLPSMAIGLVYAFTFFTLGMTFSAAGALATGVMWTLIATFRSPANSALRLFPVDSPDLFVHDLQQWINRRRSDNPLAGQYSSY
ncbi:hypothetical protein CV102_22350 [Natronococcus pandeyae]|uniref:Uncharacterized protein n=1 Tax=Natronococcus pandeyae TaxID=2055836 RepID=A0A8J8Q3D3_9EURY|nr:hypothetical protein [Natronococcus pandeyae]TYL36375.1 hypothetical protein CV102_22350 [Natronococcus pandeyae]